MNRRCRVIPSLSKATRAVHLEHPPQHTQWATSRSITQERVEWFAKHLAPITERLSVTVVEDDYAYGDESPMLSQLMVVAGRGSPGLSRVLLDMRQVLSCLLVEFWNRAV